MKNKNSKESEFLQVKKFIIPKKDNNIYNSTNNLGMINNNSENEDIKNIFLKEEFENEELKNQKLINKILNEQYIEDMFENEQYNNNNFYIIQNNCEKCNKNNKEKGFDLCKLCINKMNEILDNECLVRYLLSIEQREKFGVKNLIFENKDYSFDKLLYIQNIIKY